MEPEFLESTMEGQLFFSRNEYFINLEENEKNLGIADRNEGSWSREIDKKTKKLYIEKKIVKCCH